MAEFIKTAVSPLNIPFTGLFGLIVIYWLVVILGAVDMDVFEAEWLPDIDLDDGGGFLHSVMDVLSIGAVPVMIVFSLLVMFGWCFSLVANYYLNSGQSGWIAAGLLIPNLIVTVFLTSLILRPIRGLFKHVYADTDEGEKTMYRMGVVITGEVNSTFGQVEIETGGAPITINARTTEDTVFKKGEKVLVYDEDQEKGIYFVDKYDE